MAMEDTGNSFHNWLDSVQPQPSKHVDGAAGPAEMVYSHHHNVIISEDEEGGRGARVSLGSNGSGDPRRILFERTSVSLPDYTDQPNASYRIMIILHSTFVESVLARVCLVFCFSFFRNGSVTLASALTIPEAIPMYGPEEDGVRTGKACGRGGRERKGREKRKEDVQIEVSFDWP